MSFRDEPQPSTIDQGSLGAVVSRPASAVEQDWAAAAPPGYTIQVELGRGGMGVVYKAQHSALKRVVALKMLLAGIHAGPAEVERFKAEAKTVARLQHPNIVQIHEIGIHNNLAYLAL